MKIQKFRKSLFTKATCLLLAFTFLIIGCSPESTGAIDTPIEGNCSYFENEVLTSADVADSFENVLELARTINYQEDYSSYVEFHEDLFGESDETNAYASLFESESALYQEIGMEEYLSSKEGISENLTNYFISYSSTLESFLIEIQPDLEELTSFFTNQKNLAINSDLCEREKNLMSFYLNVSQGYAQFYYKHYYDPSATGTELRGCNFWEAIGCGLLALFVGTVVTVATALVALVGGDLTVNNKKATDEFIVLAALALGVYTGVSVYDWCCGNNEIEGQTCERPNNSIITKAECGSMVYRLWGGSTYGATEWDNVNTNPENITTDIPRLKLTVPTPGDLSIINANVSCVEGPTSVFIYECNDELIFDVDDLAAIDLEWINAPPSAANIGTPFYISVSIQGGAYNSNQIEWSISNSNINDIQPDGNSAKVIINNSFGALVTASIYDPCSEELIATISQFVTVN